MSQIRCHICKANTREPCEDWCGNKMKSYQNPGVVSRSINDHNVWEELYDVLIEVSDTPMSGMIDAFIQEADNLIVGCPCGDSDC